MTFLPSRLLILACAMLLVVNDAAALVNPHLQPSHLYAGYNHVLAAQVKQVETEALTLTLEVQEVVKGAFAPKSITLTASKEAGLESVLAVEAGQQVIAFVSQTGRQGRDKVLYYVGGGKWYVATLDPQQPAKWTLQGNADAGQDASSADIMFGVFNGSVPQLHRLVQDEAADRAYFPAQPFERFEAQALARLDKPVRGVGLYDLNADGRLDVIATSEAGVRVLVQDEQGDFQDETAKLGLTDVAARSVSIADVDADGDPDLLLDARLYRMEQGVFKATDLLPTAAGEVLSAAFVQLDGDAHADIVISRAGGGLTALLNRLSTDGKFEDATASLKLNDEANGAGGSGYFEPTDWNADGQTDLIYLTGPGLILVRGDAGFEATPIAREGEEPAEWGAAAAGPILAPAGESALLASAETKMLLSSHEPPFADVTRYGNEIQDDAPGLLMPLAVDLNADGTLDLYAATREQGATSLYLMNRGYGSFLMSEKYAGGKVFPPQVYNQPAWGLAAGDVNRDGANDLLIGGLDGTVHLLINRTLDDRPAEATPAASQALRKQIQTRLLTVIPTGPGALGARIELRDATDRLVAAGRIGGNVGVGCASAPELTIAAGEPGPHRLIVRFAGGGEKQLTVDLAPQQPRHQVVRVQAP